MILRLSNAVCAILLSSISASAENNSNNNILKVIVPNRIDSLRFGDPVFVPIAIVNSSDHERIADTLLMHRPGFTVDISSGESTIHMVFGPGAARRRFDANSVETSVLLLNIWTPSITASIAETGKCVVRFESRTAPRLAPNPRCVLTFKDTAFAQDAHDEIVEEADESIRQSMQAVGPVSFHRGNLALVPNVSPLSWHLKSKGLHSSDPFDDKDREKLSDQETKYLNEILKPNTKLSRLFQFGNAISTLSRNTTLDDWETQLPKLQNILAKSTALESEYYAGEIGRYRAVGVLPEDKLKVQDRLFHAFPLYIPLMTYTGTRARISVLDPAQPMAP